MIDIHSHILPFSDDGPKDMNDSLAMARAAVADRIQTVIATPHHRDGHYFNEKVNVINAVEALNTKLIELQIPLTIYPGQEVRMYDDLIHDLYEGKEIVTLNQSRYLLLEFPSSEVPSNTQEMIHEMSILGITPIIAHPERNKEIAANPDLMYDLVKWGALGQVTSQSLVGRFGSKVQKAGLELCKRNLIHFMASDAHNDSTRPFLMSEGYQWVSQQLGETYEEYYIGNAECVLQNEPISPLEPIKKNKKWLFFCRK